MTMRARTLAVVLAAAAARVWAQVPYEAETAPVPSAQAGARAFSETVDVVSGPGYDRIAALPEASRAHFEIRRVVTDLGAYDFESDDRTMRVRSLHPGVTPPPELLAIESIKVMPVDYAEVAVKLQAIQPYLKTWVEGK